ncbi:MAG: class I adenylate-forming enzyme family protein, partial [Bdellovibrionota bacterium]
MSLSAFDSIAQLLADLEAPEKRDRHALTFYRGKGLVGRQTYGELVAGVASVAGYLEKTLGIRRGDRILLLSPNRLEIPTLLLAIMRLGAVVVPLNPTTSPEDWVYIARHSEARGLFATPELRERLQAVHPGLEFAVDVGEVSTLKGTPSAPLPGLENELAIVLYTSGTTGNPKGVGLSQRNLLRNGWSMALNFKLDATTQFAVLPLYHAHALGFGLMTSLTSGGHLVFTDKLDPFAWAEIIRNESVKFTSVVPSLLPMLLLARVHREKVPTLQAMLVSSAPLTKELAREFETKTAIPLVQGWGLSEYTNFACCLSPYDSASDREALLFGGEITSVGSPLSGTEVMVADSHGRSLGEGESGELCVRGHSLMLAYYRDPETTRNTIQDTWLRTGDQGMFRLHGGKPVFYITGRIKEIIIRDGEKYSPLAIERKICTAMPELEGKLVVVGFPHQSHGEEIGAYLEMAEFTDALRVKLTKVIESLPIELRPKVLLHGATPIPRTHTGK